MYALATDWFHQVIQSTTLAAKIVQMATGIHKNAIAGSINRASANTTQLKKVQNCVISNIFLLPYLSLNDQRKGVAKN
jgi:hypothetical protein